MYSSGTNYIAFSFRIIWTQSKGAGYLTPLTTFATKSAGFAFNRNRGTATVKSVFTLPKSTPVNAVSTGMSKAFERWTAAATLNLSRTHRSGSVPGICGSSGKAMSDFVNVRRCIRIGRDGWCLVFVLKNSRNRFRSSWRCLWYEGQRDREESEVVAMKERLKARWVKDMVTILASESVTRNTLCHKPPFA